MVTRRPNSLITFTFHNFMHFGETRSNTLLNRCQATPKKIKQTKVKYDYFELILGENVNNMDSSCKYVKEKKYVTMVTSCRPKFESNNSFLIFSNFFDYYENIPI